MCMFSRAAGRHHEGSKRTLGVEVFIFLLFIHYIYYDIIDSILTNILSSSTPESLHVHFPTFLLSNYVEKRGVRFCGVSKETGTYKYDSGCFYFKADNGASIMDKGWLKGNVLLPLVCWFLWLRSAKGWNAEIIEELSGPVVHDQVVGEIGLC